MFKRIFLLSILLWAMSLFADAISIGHTRNGYPLIVPQVQKLKAASGTFALPRSLTVAAPDTLDLAPLVKHYSETVTRGSAERTDASALCRFELTTGNVPKSPEGYTLAVTPSGITIRARDVRGLYYGMQTLNMMLRHRADAKALKCCTVTDWPDLKVRGLFYQLGKVKPEQVDRVCHVIDVLGYLKYNTLLLSFDDNFPYRDVRFSGRKTTLSRADIERILAAAKRNHMEVIPFIQLVSHIRWAKSHPDWTKLRDGKSGCFCLSNPELQPLIETVVRETADLMKPRYFHIGLDEIEQGNFPQCPKCKAADLEALLLKHLLPVKKLLAERGITPIIFQDQFFGFGEPKIVKGLGITGFPEKFGLDTIIESWEYAPNPSPMIGRAIKARGFEKLRYMSFGINPDNVRNLPGIARKLDAEGVTLSYWNMLPATLDAVWGGCRMLYPSFIAHANYTWNTEDADFAKLPFDSSLLFQELLDGPPARSFRGKASPVSLGGAFNRRFSDDPVFPAFDAETAEKVKRIAAADPAKFDVRLQNGAPLAVVLSGSKDDGFAKGAVTIPVNTTASGASFLVTAARFNNFGLPRDQQAEAKILRIGTLDVFYADGTKISIMLFLRLNLNDWNTYLGGGLCRAALRGNDRNGSLFSLYAIDWRNPHPDKEIKKIVFSSKGGTGSSPVLFAVSLSDAAKTPTGAVGTPSGRLARAHRPAAKRTLAVDFSGKRPRMHSKATGINGYTFRIIGDPERGRVLEMRMPEITRFLARSWINIGVRPPSADFESVVFDIRVSDWSAVCRPDIYMMKGKAETAAANFACELGDRWITVCIPRERLFAKAKKLTPDMANTLRFGFFMLDNGRPCTIRIGNIYYCDRVLPCRSNVTTPVK